MTFDFQPLSYLDRWSDLEGSLVESRLQLKLGVEEFLEIPISQKEKVQVEKTTAMTWAACLGIEEENDFLLKKQYERTRTKDSMELGREMERKKKLNFERKMKLKMSKMEMK